MNIRQQFAENGEKIVGYGIMATGATVLMITIGVVGAALVGNEASQQWLSHHPAVLQAAAPVGISLVALGGYVSSARWLHNQAQRIRKLRDMRNG